MRTNSIKLPFIFCISFVLVVAESACSQFNQTLLEGLDEDNKNLIEISSGEKREFFPVMLVGFERELENRTDHPDWNKGWGFNIIQSWHGLHFDRNNHDYKAGKDSVLKAANSNGIFTAFDQTFQNSKVENSKLLMLYDESIHDGHSSGDLTARKNKLVDRVKDASDADDFIWFANFSTRPFFVRYDSLKQNIPDKEIVFESNIAYKYKDKTSTMSYDEAARHADIIAFDFYPWGYNGSEAPYLRKNSFQTNFVNTSVGEFTGLMKRKYTDKAVWTYIQTTPFHPYPASETYKDHGEEHYISGDIIRHLTFSAIINGADGIIFWGQTRFQYPNSLAGKVLHEAEERSWKYTLEQCYELYALQTHEYHKILLEDNVSGSYRKDGLVEYCYKQVRQTSSEFYIFITSSSDEEITKNIYVPDGFIFSDEKPLTIDKYQGVPEYRGSGTITLDFSEENSVNSVARDKRSFETTLKPYGTNIFYVELESD